MRVAAPALALLLALSLAGPTPAKDALFGAFDLTGTHSQKGAFQGEAQVESTGEAIHVLVRARYGDGSSELLRGRVWADSETNPAHRLEGERLGDELRVEAGVFGGMNAALDAAPSGGQAVLIFRVLDGGPRCSLSVTFPDGRTLTGEGRARGDWKDLAGHLLVYSPDGLKAEVKQLLGMELKKALKQGVDVRQRLKLTDFLHVGIGADVAWLPEEELTDDQLRTLAASPGKVWLETKVEGGIRLPFGASIPLGGAANVSLGFQPGLELNYELVELYDRPAGVTDLRTVAANVKAIAKRVIDLPLDAAEAEALVPGAERSLQGVFTVAVSGSLGIGYDTHELNDMLEVGASARVGGFYRLRRDLRLGVVRLGGRAVRLRLENGRGTSIGAEARAFVGASINEDAVVEEVAPSAEYLEPVVKLAANGVDQVVKDVLRFELSGSAAKDQSQSIDLAWRLDLANPTARAAYERAVRGDLTVLDRLAGQQGSGVELQFRVLDLERHAWDRANLTVSLLAKGQLSKDVTEQLLSVQDGDKLTRYEMFRFHKRRALGLMKWIKELRKEWDEALYVEWIRAVPQNGAAAAALDLPEWIPARRSLTFRYDLQDPFTRKGEMARLRRVVAALGLNAINDVPTPSAKPFRTRWGKTEAHLRVQISEVGVWVLHKQTPEQLEAAFLSAYAVVHDETPGSDKARKQAAAFVTHFRGATLADTPADRSAHMRALCEDAGWDLTLVTAVRSLVPDSSLHLQVAVDGKRIDFDGELTGRKYQPLVPVVPGD